MSQINESAIKTPVVNINEIPSLAPSVAQVATAIPAFIGYTEKAQKIIPGDLRKIPTSISSLLEYQQYFGGAAPMNIVSVKLNELNFVSSSEIKSNFYLYDSIRMFYFNGGSKCYIMSIGSYNDTVDKDAFINDGLMELEKYDGPTLILFPDAIKLNFDLYEVQKQALMQCKKLQDRFCILDLLEIPNWKSGYGLFRENIGVLNLNYGSAYTPYLKSSLPIHIKYSDFFNTLVTPATSKITKAGSIVDLRTLTSNTNAINSIINWNNLIQDLNILKSNLETLITGERESLAGEWTFLVNEFLAEPIASNEADFLALFTYLYKIIKLVDNCETDFTGDFENKGLKKKVDDLITNSLKTTASNLISYDKGAEDNMGPGYNVYTGLTIASTKWNNIFTSAHTDPPVPDTLIFGTDPDEGNRRLAALPALNQVFELLHSGVTQIVSAAQTFESIYEETLLESHSIYKSIVASLKNSLVILPPCGAIAGIYTTVDSTMGVWKAPANVSLNSVKGPSVLIDDKTQQDLKIDTTAGKSINAIRSFTGKGTLVWGARTLAGNDNEWRYVSVRRLFIMVEQSAKKATAQFVFEPNASNTWIKVRAMLENYLTVLWRQGALEGAKPEHAFFVNCGLGQTMTELDILEGRLIVEIGMAAVRPAEFIILRFMHKMNES